MPPPCSVDYYFCLHCGRTPPSNTPRVKALLLSYASLPPCAGATSEVSESVLSVLPLRPIGHVHSCFSQRNGTPRQPLLVPAARCTLTLAADISPAALVRHVHISAFYSCVQSYCALIQIHYNTSHCMVFLIMHHPRAHPSLDVGSDPCQSLRVDSTEA